MRHWSDHGVYYVCNELLWGGFFHLGSGVQRLKASDTGRGTSVINPPYVQHLIHILASNEPDECTSKAVGLIALGGMPTRCDQII